MAKSAQLGLHAWLPTAMEGEITSNYFYFSKTTMPLMQEEKLLNNNSNSINTSKFLIWIYDINFQTFSRKRSVY
jgi:hypothetical protein